MVGAGVRLCETCCRRLAAVLAVVRSLCEEAAVYKAAREDGRIDDAEVAGASSGVQGDDGDGVHLHEELGVCQPRGCTSR